VDRKEITQILASAGLRPQHQFGQNFMVDQNVLHAIADAGAIVSTDLVLEVGPGVGNLTRVLATRASAGHVLAVDIDYKLMPAAQRHHAELTNVTWLNVDVLAGKHAVESQVLEQLKTLRDAHPASALKLVSNLPYNAASPLIAELLVEMWRELRGGDPHGRPLEFSRMAFTVQWEVGLRMAGGHGTRDYGPLGILIQTFADVEIVRKIPPGAFWPPPKIHSALVTVVPVLERMRQVRDAVALQQFLAGIFSHRRQTLGNALKHYYGDRWSPDFKRKCSEVGFDLLQRPENLPPPELVRLEETANTMVRGAVA
jgi:16S rRNA (adenine1518-N6/adenine1519-N6)-dimethyltransferase